MVFIVVRYGDKKESLFNANCMVAALLDNIKKRCGLDKATSIDICDDAGCMSHLEDYLRENGSKFLKERTKYVLVKKEKSEERKVIYTSLLNGLQRSNPELLGLIEGRAIETEETAQPPSHDILERKKSLKFPEKKPSLASLKKKSRANNKFF